MRKLSLIAVAVFATFGASALAGGITFHTGNTNNFGSDVRYLLQQAGGDVWINSCIVNGVNQSEEMTCVSEQLSPKQNVYRLNYSYPTAWNILRINADRTGTVEYWAIDQTTGKARCDTVYKGIWKIK